MSPTCSAGRGAQGSGTWLGLCGGRQGQLEGLLRFWRTAVASNQRGAGCASLKRFHDGEGGVGGMGLIETGAARSAETSKKVKKHGADSFRTVCRYGLCAFPTPHLSYYTQEGGAGQSQPIPMGVLDSSSHT
jgi:hypothetical protein